MQEILNKKSADFSSETLETRGYRPMWPCAKRKEKTQNRPPRNLCPENSVLQEVGKIKIGPEKPKLREFTTVDCPATNAWRSPAG